MKLLLLELESNWTLLQVRTTLASEKYNRYKMFLPSARAPSTPLPEIEYNWILLKSRTTLASEKYNRYKMYLPSARAP